MAQAVFKPPNETRCIASAEARSRLLPLRKRWVQIHRWLGIGLGPLLVLIGLTGSLLVFDHAIDEWLHPNVLLTEGQGVRQPLEKIVAAAERHYDGGASRALSVSSPRVEEGVWTVWFQTGTEGAPKFVSVHVDPYTARVTGQRVWGEDLLSWIYRLHFRLLSGGVGATIVGLMGVVMLVSIVTGVMLWWPLWRHSWRAAFVVRRGKRFAYEFHKTLGVTSMLVLSVIAFTGVYMEFPEWIKPLVTSFSPETLPPEGLKSSVVQSRPTITPETAIGIACARYPDARFCHFHPPGSEEGVYEVAVRQPAEVQLSFGRTQLFIDQYSGEIVAERTPEKFTVADAFIAWQFPLHNGEAFGLLGRWLVFITGFAPLILYLTGMLVWIRKTRARGRQRGLASSA